MNIAVSLIQQNCIIMNEHKPQISIKKLSNEEKELINKLTKKFGNTLLYKDLDALDELLDDRFKYLSNLSKTETLQYFKEQFELSIPHIYYCPWVEYKFCRRCAPGNPTLVFHNGYWPFVTDDPENNRKGLMLCFEDAQISDISYCYSPCDQALIDIIVQCN